MAKAATYGTGGARGQIRGMGGSCNCASACCVPGGAKPPGYRPAPAGSPYPASYPARTPSYPTAEPIAPPDFPASSVLLDNGGYPPRGGYPSDPYPVLLDNGGYPPRGGYPVDYTSQKTPSYYEDPGTPEKTPSYYEDPGTPEKTPSYYQDPYVRPASGYASGSGSTTSGSDPYGGRTGSTSGRTGSTSGGTSGGTSGAGFYNPDGTYSNPDGALAPDGYVPPQNSGTPQSYDDPADQYNNQNTVTDGYQGEYSPAPVYQLPADAFLASAPTGDPNVSAKPVSAYSNTSLLGGGGGRTLNGLRGLRGLTAQEGFAVRRVTISRDTLARWAYASLSERKDLVARDRVEDLQATVPARYMRRARQLGDLALLQSLEDPNVVTGVLPDEPPAANLGPDGWPASPGFRPGNWEGGQPTSGKNRYMLASGDTLSGLAKCYLGGPQRWREIWDAGGNKDTYGNPDQLPAGGWIDMPAEATQAAIALMGDPSAARKPASPGAPGSVPGAKDPADSPAGSWSTNKKLAVGAAAAGAAVLGYLALR